MHSLKVGFIGLGIMGKPMAENLIRAGYPLTVFNRTRSKTESLSKLGAAVADSPAQLAADSEIIIIIVSDSPDVEAVMTGPNGVAEGIRPGSIVVDMSTVSPELERQLNKLLMEKGCSLVDAPVSGGDTGAQQGTLAIMAGGEQASFDRVRPLFEVMGQSITYCGSVGNGQLTKLCNQILVSVNLLAVCEALVFARRNGLDPSVMIEAVKGGAAGSWQLSNLGIKVVRRDFAPGFMVDLIRKDLRLILESAQYSESSLPAASLVQQLFSAAGAQGFGREGTQSLAKVLERLSALPQEL